MELNIKYKTDMIKFLDLQKVTAKYAEEIHEAVLRVVDSGWYLQGKENAMFETHYSSYIGTKYTIGCANGLDALIWIFRAYIEMGIMKPGDEVIVPANTYIASILAITENGLIPVLVEPNLETYQIDDSKIEKAITSRTRAILIVHLYGQCAYTEKIGELCEKYNDGRFAEEINSIFKHNNVTYEIKHGRIISTLHGSINTNEVIGLEKGVKDLIIEAEKHYHDGEKNIAVEKIWDAFERMKTYYLPELDKRKSAEKIVDDMSQGIDAYKKMFDNEFLTLTKMGNEFRIRHHEMNKIDITDNRQYEYFYKRCFALVSVAIQYLER